MESETRSVALETQRWLRVSISIFLQSPSFFPAYLHNRAAGQVNSQSKHSKLAYVFGLHIRRFLNSRNTKNMRNTIGLACGQKMAQGAA